MHATHTSARRGGDVDRAFTLIELIVVIVIVAVLVGIAAVGYTSVINHSHNTKTEVSLRQLHKMAMATAAAEQRPVTLADFDTAAPEVPSLAALAPTPALLAAAGSAHAVADDGTQLPAGSTGIVRVSLDPANPNIVGLAARSTTGDCVTLSGNGLNATTMIGGGDCTGGAALTIAQTQAQLPTPTGTTGTPTSSPTTSSTTAPTTTTTTTSPTSTTTTTTPPPPPPAAPSRMSFATYPGKLLSNNWAQLTYGAGQFVAVSPTSWATSTDGVSWTTGSYTFAANTTVTALRYGNGKFVVVSAGGIPSTSTDGVHWTSGPYIGSVPTNMHFGSGQFVVLTTNRNTYTSTDGVTWSSNAANFGVSTNAGCLVEGGGVWMAHSEFDNKTHVTTTPQTGTSWVSSPSTVSGMVGGERCAYGNGRFLIATRNGTGTYVSANGTTWTRSTTVATSSFATFANGEFAAGDNTTGLWTSTDGVAWTKSSASLVTMSGARSSAYGNGMLVVLDGGGNVSIGK